MILLTFFTSLITVFLAYSLSRTGGKVSISHLLLVGIALSAFLTSVTQILAYFFIDNPKVVIVSLLGSCSNLTWTEVGVVVFVTALCSAALIFFGRDLNAFSSGEDSAKRLGVNVEKSKFLILGLSTLIASITIPFCGIIGFVGLIIPHVVRVFIGPDHTWLLPGSVFTGGLFLLVCDLFARTAIRPYQIPVGIVTGVVGGLFFIYLISVKRRWRA
jgi:iron complex transport system permease protein